MTKLVRGLGSTLSRVTETILSLLAVLALMLTTSLATGQKEKPNFSGRWEMDESRSELSARLRSSGYRESLLIEHREPKLKITYSLRFEGQEGTWVFNLTTDGAENINQTLPGEEKSRTHWGDGKLITEWKVESQMQQGKIVRSLSEDGQTQFVEYHNPGGVMKLVFGKK